MMRLAPVAFAVGALGPLVLVACAQQPEGSSVLARLQFTKGYFPGTRDANGQYMGGTEAMWLAGFQGRLYAGIGYGQDQPGEDPQPGAQIICKDASDAPWRVDHAFGPGFMRTEALVPIRFTTDHTGQKLGAPVEMLIASPSDTRRGNSEVAVWVLGGAGGGWQCSRIAPGYLGARAIGSHVDKVTGVHLVFAGLNRGPIHAGAYDPTVPGGIRWYEEPERTVTTQYRSDGKVYDYSRVLCFAECNGDLYMASRITLDAADQPADGGLYRRVDGVEPRWDLVYRWPVDTAILQSRYLRGLTAVPDPAGSGRECLIAAFEYPGTIVRFAPTADGASVTATQELDIKEYFNEAWGTPGARRRGAIAAYNRFLPVADPVSGATVWMCGAWVERPGSPNPPDNGSCYLIRHQDGRYEWGYIDDPTHPLPAGQRLTGCRDIEPSPVADEAGRVFYFCGYDGGAGPSHNTAWIYRGDTTDEEATHEEQASTLTPAGPRSPLDSTGGGMESYQGIRYRELPDVDPNLLSLDVYAPKGAQNLPVLFWIHGGGLTGGSKFVGRGLPQFCSRVGMVLVSMNYRLSPAVKHPAHVEDCAAAFTWTHDHIHEYGGDPNRMFVSGHSSGAQLAGLLSADARRLADVGLGLANITGAILFDSAAYDMTTRRATDDSIYAKAFGTDPEVLRDGSPLLHVAPGHNTPPHLLVGAKAPGQTAEAKLQKLEAVAARYRAAGVRCEVVGAFFRQHNTVISEFGPAEEPVTVEVTKFIQSILNAEPVDPALGQAKVLELPGRSAEEVERENDISSARTLVKILDTDTDGRVSRAEAEARGQSWLRWFPSLDKDQDGFITVEEQR